MYDVILFAFFVEVVPYSLKYRVSSKGVYAFDFQISRAPRGLEIPSWAFFNSPFSVDFENIQFVIFWLNLDRDIRKILQGCNFKT